MAPSLDVTERILESNDRWHGPHSALDPERYQEWAHFCINDAELHIIVNFSLTLEANQLRGRVLVLCRSPDGTWAGGFDDAAEVELDGSATRLRIGGQRCEYERGRYSINVAIDDVALDCTLVPSTEPYLKNNIRLGTDDVFHWLAVPQLRVRGVGRVAGRQVRLDNATAYHDHNWGTFDWGGNFSWEWGFSCFRGDSTPEPERSVVVFVRVSDKGRQRTLTQALLVWRGWQLVRAFRDDELSVRRHSLLAQSHAATVPAVMRLLVPETASDVPAVLEVETSSRASLRLRFQSADLARIVVPHSTDLGATTVNETYGHLSLEGEIAGERLRGSGAGNFEFLS